MSTQIEVREETAARLRTITSTCHLSLDEYLSGIADLIAPPPTNGQAQAADLTPFELVEDLFGSVDSSLPDDPATPADVSPPRRKTKKAGTESFVT